ncbi:MAG: hypothetical protein ABI717_03800 [Actinomycetota bacterium]
MSRLAVAVVFPALCLIAAGSASPRPSASALLAGPLETAIVDTESLSSGETAAKTARIHSAGARTVRLILYWATVAPRALTKPAGFDAANPSDPAYRWDEFDREVRSAVSGGLRPIVGIQLAPAWAERSGGRPDPAELAAFARAAATRYGGSFAGLPRVRIWQAWNEPNLSVFLNPQFNGTDSVSPEIYRAMVNAFADSVHSVHSDNVVVAGGLAPYGHPLSPRVSFTGVSPLRFMRELLCMAGRTIPRPSCSTQVRFDVWSHHPYTAGGPTQQARNPDDASIGDLAEMRRLLDAASRAGHIVAQGRLRFWVTEFSWDSNPPDASGVPAKLHARWVAEGMYRMWQSGVSLVTWFKLTDDPPNVSRYQSGLFRSPTQPKLALRAFRFPFVAFPSRGRVFVWGRTPLGAAGTVVVEQRRHGLWSRRASLMANRYGIFTARVARSGSGNLRARVAGETSLEFSLTKPRDFSLETPFGD